MSARPVWAVVNVRMGSQRLPGKVLRPMAGKPMLGHLLDRLALARRLDGCVVATSTRPENDAVADYCAARGTPCFRGAEDDVLGRTLGALTAQGAATGVVAFGDGPLIDPALVDQFVDRFTQSDLDFLGNDLATTYPPGMEVEVFRVAALADSDRRCDDPAIREHGTLFIRRNPERYRLVNIEAPAALRRPELEMEVDTEEDFQVISAVLETFVGRPDFSLAEIIAFLDANPGLSRLNRDVPRRWKAFRPE